MPGTVQMKRGVAIYLHSLRVSCHLVRHGKHTNELHNGILYLLDLLSRFPPALRTMHILLLGKTPLDAECATLSHAVYHVLADIVPPGLISNNDRRRFEGSRLLFCLLIEKSKHLRLSSEDCQALPFSSYFHIVKVRRTATGEPAPYIEIGGAMPTTLASLTHRSIAQEDLESLSLPQTSSTYRRVA